MHYFIIGGAGFIGSTMADRLLEEYKVRVTIFDNFSSGREEFIQHNLSNPRFKVVKGDLLDFDSLRESMSGTDFVLHFASNSDIARSVAAPDLDLKQGIIATFNVLEAMRKNQIKLIAYSSGSGVYGDVGYNETSEDFGPLMPISMYGASKLACEGMISAFCHLYDMKAWIYRFANVVGRRQTHGVGYDFIRKLRKNPKELEILGNGSQSKSYIHVSDIIDAMLFVIRNANDKVNVFNVATSDYIEVNAIAKIVIEEMDLKNVKITYTGGDRGWKGDVPIVRFNLNKIHVLGWKAKYSSENAVRLSIREMINNLSQY
jgi:UDP-glucose 4-epimerase